MRLTARERIQVADALAGDADFPERFYSARNLRHTCPQCGGLGVMVPYDEVSRCDRCHHHETIAYRVRQMAQAAMTRAEGKA